MNRLVVIALAATLGLSLGCGDQTDLRVTGANRAAQSLTNLRSLWDSLQGGAAPNATNAQNALVELARLPGGLAAMLLRPIDLPTGSTNRSASAADFSSCTTISRDAVTQCESADFSAGCSAGGVNLTGSGKRCVKTECSQGHVYSGQLSASLGGGGVSANLGLTLSDVCVTPTSASGSLTTTVKLSIPQLDDSDFTLTARVTALRFENGKPVAGSINVSGSGTFVGGPLAGCVTVEFSGATVTLRRVSDTTCAQGS